jgi:CSLREA domain-containing protein
MKSNHTFWGWNDKFNNESFLPQSKTFINKAIVLFAFFSFVVLFNANGVDAATFTVTTTADNEANGCAVKQCTFREAITAANALAGDDTIDFQIGVIGKIYLTRGPLLISNNINIESPEIGDLNIVGNYRSNIFISSNTGVTTNIKSLTITGRNAHPISDISNLIESKLAPTDAAIQIGGKVKERSGRAISGSFVIVNDSFGQNHVSFSNTFGYFRVFGIPAGQTCVVMAYHNRYTFYPQIITPFKDVNGISVVAGSPDRKYLMK